LHCAATHTAVLLAASRTRATSWARWTSIDNNRVTKQIDNIVENTVVFGIPIRVMKFFPGPRVSDGAHALIEPNQLKVALDAFL
jgi:hypothetical protein